MQKAWVPVIVFFVGLLECLKIDTVKISSMIIIIITINSLCPQQVEEAKEDLKRKGYKYADEFS